MVSCAPCMRGKTRGAPNPRELPLVAIAPGVPALPCGGRGMGKKFVLTHCPFFVSIASYRKGIHFLLLLLKQPARRCPAWRAGLFSWGDLPDFALRLPALPYGASKRRQPRHAKAIRRRRLDSNASTIAGISVYAQYALLMPCGRVKSKMALIL